MVKNPPAIQETWVQFLGQEDPLKEEMATHSSILAWRISMNRGAWRVIVQSHKELDMTKVTDHACTCLHTKISHFKFQKLLMLLIDAIQNFLILCS